MRILLFAKAACLSLLFVSATAIVCSAQIKIPAKPFNSPKNTILKLESTIPKGVVYKKAFAGITKLSSQNVVVNKRLKKANQAVPYNVERRHLIAKSHARNL